MAWPGCVCLMCVGALFVAVLLLFSFSSSVGATRSTIFRTRAARVGRKVNFFSPLSSLLKVPWTKGEARIIYDVKEVAKRRGREGTERPAPSFWLSWFLFLCLIHLIENMEIAYIRLERRRRRRNVIYWCVSQTVVMSRQQGKRRRRPPKEEEEELGGSLSLSLRSQQMMAGWASVCVCVCVFVHM